MAATHPDVARGARVQVVAQVLVVAAGLVWLYGHRPGPDSVLKCPFHQLTGLWCPGCGTTRALYALLHGHVAYAFREHPIVIPLVPVFIVAWVRSLRRTWRGEPGVPWQPRPWLAWGILWGILTFFVLRNVPAWPFTLLAPLG